ncbi:hypothetical protein [Bacillus marinisedimentorum]|uniref:hypothetical protein n=1 Tax=Bacillus marinisedimentorum TaxID=1821260 RepID=UPI0009F316AD|nr:hypothetical protein [Bacillus marinisedimentorum]
MLWFIFSFVNPYASASGPEPAFNTFFMLVLPAAMAIRASLSVKKSFMLIAFLWSLPLSLYFALTPGIFALFTVTSSAYLLSFLLMGKEERPEGKAG